MMLTKPSEHMTPNKRLKSWAKHLRSCDDVDVTKERGYALLGPWVKNGEWIDLQPGECLVVAQEHGSWAHHFYEYLLVQCQLIDGAEVLRQYDWREVLALLETEVRPKQLAAARNSTPYAFALFVALHGNEGA